MVSIWLVYWRGKTDGIKDRKEITLSPGERPAQIPSFFQPWSIFSTDVVVAVSLCHGFDGIACSVIQDVDFQLGGGVL